jgi:hypothetical protein
MTGVNFVSRVLKLLHDPNGDKYTDSTFFVEIANMRLSFLNMELSRVQNKFYLSVASGESLLAGTNTYLLPDGSGDLPSCNGLISHVDVVRSDSTVSLMGNNDIIDFDSTAVGDPTRVAVVGDYVYFDRKPTTTATFNLYYYRTATGIASATDTSRIDFPVGFHSLLVFHVAAAMAASTHDQDSGYFLQQESVLMSRLLTMPDPHLGMDNIRTGFPDTRDAYYPGGY